MTFNNIKPHPEITWIFAEGAPVVYLDKEITKESTTVFCKKPNCPGCKSMRRRIVKKLTIPLLFAN